jgi:glucose/arabinose dehydrogenase
LVDGLKNSVNFEFAPDGRVFIIDRYGEIVIYKPDQQISTSAGTIPVFNELEDGLLGIEFDPGFLTNNYIYLNYSPLNVSVNRLSRFTMNGDLVDLGSEVVLLEWPTQRDICCHSGGDLAFDSKGNLYIAVGDNTTHSLYATFDETDSNKSSENTSSNTNDLRGKILRITPQTNGTYTIPSGNLFPGGNGGLPEIYVMGARNPYRIYIDKENTDWLFWGEVGPDADNASPNGPKGLDEINLTKQAGNYGWPYFSGEIEPYRNT